MRHSLNRTRKYVSLTLTAAVALLALGLVALTIFGAYEVARVFQITQANRSRLLWQTAVIVVAYLLGTLVFLLLPRLRLWLAALALFSAGILLFANSSAVWHPASFDLTRDLFAVAFWQALLRVLLALTAAAAVVMQARWKSP